MQLVLTSVLLAEEQAISCWTDISEWNILCFSADKTPQPKQSSLLPSLPSSLQSQWLWHPKWFHLKDPQVVALLWDDMYHPFETLLLSVDGEGRHLDSFKWGQQTSRLPAWGRFDTTSIGTVCREEQKHNHTVPVLNSDFQSQLRMYSVDHCKVQTCHEHMASLDFHLTLLKCWVLIKSSTLAKCTVVSGGKML